MRRGGNTFLASLVLGWGVNIVALLVVDWMFGSVAIDRWGSLLGGAAVLAVANAILKPVLAVLTLPLIIITLGLGYFGLNVLMLAIAEWVAPHFSVNGFWTYIGATIVISIVNWVLHAVLDGFGGSRRSLVRVGR